MSNRLAPLLVLLLLAACRSQGASGLVGEPEPAEVRPGAPTSSEAATIEGFVRASHARESDLPPPLDAAGEHDSVWDYLRGRYDADGDGLVSREEYPRGAGTFERLDRDGDGALSAADLELSAEGGAGRVVTAALRAQLLFALYLQDDGWPDRLSLEEAGEVVAAYDADGDGRLTGAEFASAAPRRRALGLEPQGRAAGLLREVDPWQGLREGVDRDGDGALAREELLAFVREQAAGGEFWDLAQGAATAGRPRGVPEGRPAPDFELELLGAGARGTGRTVRLSSFAGEKPVALIFGSYT